MANQYREYSKEDYSTFIEKYDELVTIREAAVLLTGEKKKKNAQAIIKALEERALREKKYKCPSHLCLNMTPSKRKTVEETWEELVQELIKSGARDESISYIVSQMSKEESIEEVRKYLLEKKKLALTSNEKKSPTRSFSRTRNK